MKPRAMESASRHGGAPVRGVLAPSRRSGSLVYPCIPRANAPGRLTADPSGLGSAARRARRTSRFSSLARLGGGGVPEDHLPVVAARGESRAVGTERHAPEHLVGFGQRQKL